MNYLLHCESNVYWSQSSQLYLAGKSINKYRKPNPKFRDCFPNLPENRKVTNDPTFDSRSWYVDGKTLWSCSFQFMSTRSQDDRMILQPCQLKYMGVNRARGKTPFRWTSLGSKLLTSWSSPSILHLVDPTTKKVERMVSSGFSPQLNRKTNETGHPLECSGSWLRVKRPNSAWPELRQWTGVKNFCG